MIFSDFFNNQAEKKTGLDLNADGFVGGEGRYFQE